MKSLFVLAILAAAVPVSAENVPPGALRLMQAGCNAAKGSDHNGFKCFQSGVEALLHGRGRYGLVSAMCTAAAGSAVNGWSCFSAASRVLISEFNDAALRPVDTACRAAAGTDHGGFRCFSRAFADLASRERLAPAEKAAKPQSEPW